MQPASLQSSLVRPAVAPSNPSLVELAELCKASYEDKSPQSFPHPREQVTWGLSDRWSRLSFYSALYRRESAVSVLAFRGTDGILDVLADDAAIAAGAVPPTIALAIDSAAKVGRNVILTGHSLGGALAIIAGCRFKLPVVTFNAPGVMDSCVMAATSPSVPVGGLRSLMQMLARCLVGTQILNVRIDADPVSSFFTTGFQSGTSTTLPGAQCGFNPLCRHAMDTCIAAVRSRSGAFDPVRFR